MTGIVFQVLTIFLLFLSLVWSAQRLADMQCLKVRQDFGRLYERLSGMHFAVGHMAGVDQTDLPGQSVNFTLY